LTCYEVEKFSRYTRGIFYILKKVKVENVLIFAIVKIRFSDTDHGFISPFSEIRIGFMLKYIKGIN